jgi:hypothetical protein
VRGGQAIKQTSALFELGFGFATWKSGVYSYTQVLPVKPGEAKHGVSGARLGKSAKALKKQAGIRFRTWVKGEG